MTDPIQYNEEIPKKEFKEFLEVIKKIDPTTHAEEKQDGFLDLYNYWSNNGYGRFREKVEKNLITLAS